jgi:hypothetical protein
MHTIIPEKYGMQVQESGPAKNPAQTPEAEKIPAIIKKYLIRRNNSLKKDPALE